MAKSGVTGNGAQPRVSASDITVDASIPSAQPAERSIGKRRGRPPKDAEEPLDGAEVLAILENALMRVQERWGPVAMRESLDDGSAGVDLPPAVVWCQHCYHLREVANMTNGKCNVCQGVTQ